MTKAVAYIRVSSDEQVKNTQGLDIQREELKEYAEKNNIDLVKSFEDQGISGANDINKRQGLNDLLEYIKENDIDQLLITKVDRLARDLYLQLWIEKELKIYEVELISINEDNLNGNDYMTKAMRQMMGVFAELEKSRISDRLVRGRKRKAKKGKKASGNCPLGYKYEYDKSGRNSKVVIDKEKAEIVKEIFSLYLQGNSLSKVSKALAEKGHKTSRGNDFSKYSLSKILKNDFYTGIVRFGDIEKEGQHKPIINKITFGKVQAKLNRNRKK